VAAPPPRTAQIVKRRRAMTALRRAITCAVLGLAGLQGCMSARFRALHAERPEARALAIRHLSGSRATEIATLSEALSDRDAVVGLAAAEALWIRGAPGRQILVRGLAEAPPRLCASAAILARYDGNPGTLSVLGSALTRNASDPCVESTAVALGALVYPAVVDALSTGVLTPHNARIACQEGEPLLEWMNERLGVDVAVVGAYQNWLTTPVDDACQRRVVQGLTKVVEDARRRPRALEALSAFPDALRQVGVDATGCAAVDARLQRATLGLPPLPDDVAFLAERLRSTNACPTVDPRARVRELHQEGLLQPSRTDTLQRMEVLERFGWSPRDAMELAASAAAQGRWSDLVPLDAEREVALLHALSSWSLDPREQADVGLVLADADAASLASFLRWVPAFTDPEIREGVLERILLHATLDPEQVAAALLTEATHPGMDEEQASAFARRVRARCGCALPVLVGMFSPQMDAASGIRILALVRGLDSACGPVFGALLGRASVEGARPEFAAYARRWRALATPASTRDWVQRNVCVRPLTDEDWGIVRQMLVSRPQEGRLYLSERIRTCSNPSLKPEVEARLEAIAGN